MSAPCASCPFRRSSERIPEMPELVLLLVHQAESDGTCSEIEGDCIGSHIYMNNSCKVPRKRDFAERVARAGTNKLIVFASLQQLTNHHKPEEKRP